MVSLRFAVPAVLVAAAVAACFTYFVAPPTPEADRQLPPASPNAQGPATGTPVNIGQHLSPEEEATAAFKRASKMILRRLPEAQAAAGTNGLPITGRIPLPRRRPIPSAVTP
jgi:hypothetical protein